MTKMIDVEVWLMIDADGNYVAHDDAAASTVDCFGEITVTVVSLSVAL